MLSSYRAMHPKLTSAGSKSIPIQLVIKKPDSAITLSQLDLQRNPSCTKWFQIQSLHVIGMSQSSKVYHPSSSSIHMQNISDYNNNDVKRGCVVLCVIIQVCVTWLHVHANLDFITLLFHHSSPCIMDTLSTDLGRINIFDVLSFDLLSTIFSELTRNDVLECMLVSRQWQRCVPHYASQWFRRIVLNGRGDLDLYSSFMQAVGQFAQVVVLESFSSSSTSHKAVTEILPRFFPNVETLRE